MSTFDFDKLKTLFSYDPNAPLLFTGGMFLFLFLAFLILYIPMQNHKKIRIAYVTLFSYYFYYKTGGLFILLLILVTCIDFFIGKKIYRSDEKKKKKLWLGLSIIVNLGMLCYFKYTNFFYELFCISENREFVPLNILLPVGISFFTFQSMSYTIDIYRKVITPLNSLSDYAFYVSFFPQLVAGPIVRAKDFLPQIYLPLTVTKEMFGRGIFLIISGLFKKAIISDYISINFVDRIFDAPILYSGIENLFGIYGYALQIYCDFSGYSDMAIGIALLLGYRFNINFDSPYKSASITEFWRRWHISLSSWLKDYLYISLGGNRKGKIRTYINLMITMLLGGLWHGASLRFICWGAIHGVSLAIHKFLMHIFPSLKADGSKMTVRSRIFGILFTFHLVCFGWIFFRADSFEIGISMIRQIIFNFHPEVLPEMITGYSTVFILMTIGFILHFIPQSWETAGQKFIVNSSLSAKALFLVVLIVIVFQFKSAEIQPFIYFQF